MHIWFICLDFIHSFFEFQAFNDRIQIPKTLIVLLSSLKNCKTYENSSASTTFLIIWAHFFGIRKNFSYRICHLSINRKKLVYAGISLCTLRRSCVVMGRVCKFGARSPAWESPGQAWNCWACKTQAWAALLGVEPELNLRLDPLLVMWLGHWPMAFKYNDVWISYNFVKIYPYLVYQKQKAEH